MSIKNILIIPLLFTHSILTAQTIESWMEQNEKIPAEKIYIHTDTENYFHTDTLWYKVYLTDSRSGQLIPRAENIYINLTGEDGSVVYRSVLLAVNGTAEGSIFLPDSLKPGFYAMQAFTNYLKNFTADAHFYKRISISRNLVTGRSSGVKPREENLVADLSFMPEGGVLLENVTNVVAFKAVSREGYGVNVRGTVKDEKGNTITTFATDYKGMGLFFLTPETGKTYSVQVAGFPQYKHIFEPVKNSVKIQLVNHTSKEVIVNIAGNSELFNNQKFYMVNMHRGEVVFYRDFVMEGLNKVLKFESASLKDGINRLVLLNSTLLPVSERLLFSKPENVNNLQVIKDKPLYKKREPATLKIADEVFADSAVFSNLSVSVVNNLSLANTIPSKNILSHLLVDSELNGFTEASSDLFIDNNLSSEAKLRLVMLTNGWSSYFWNTAPEKNIQLEFKQTAGLNLKGVAINPLTQSPIRNGEITLVLQKNDEMAFVTRTTDDNGNFLFPGLLFKDTASVYVQAKTEGGKLNTEISLESIYLDAGISESQIKLLKDRLSVPNELSQLKYREFAEKRKLQPRSRRNRNSGNNAENDGRFRLYQSADFVLEVEDGNQTFGNVIDYMAGKIPGLDISGNDVRIRGTSSFANSSLPLFLIDGVPLVVNTAFNLPEEIEPQETSDGLTKAEEQLIQSVKSIPVNDIEKIEVLKSPGNLAVFGTKGANGVIAIYTRKGVPTQGGVTRGILEKTITGYSGFKTFYSPAYLPDNTKNTADFRTTLYWNPELIIKNGEAGITFYTSDEPGQYSIIVEGISTDGKICTGSATFEIK